MKRSIILTAVFVVSIMATGVAPVSAATVDLEVSTDTPANVSATAATLNGTVDTLNGVGSANATFQYRDSNATVWSNSTAQTVSSTGSFNQTVDGLKANTTYEYRAVVQNSTNTANGNVVSFTTPDPIGAAFNAISVGGLPGEVVLFLAGLALIALDEMG